MFRLLKARVSKRAHGHGDQVRPLLGAPEDRPAAFRAEPEGYAPSAVGLADVLPGGPQNPPDLLARIPGLNAENASRSALACEAVAHGNANGLPMAGDAELSAGAGRFAIRHARCPFD
jgi:hypothetical protein